MVKNKINRAEYRRLLKSGRGTSLQKGKVPSFYPQPFRAETGMNKLEQDYALYLEGERAAGNIVGWVFEGMTFKLAYRTTYTPDFLVVTKDGFEIHETKGFLRDDANVKFKVAAEKFPWFRFKMVFRKKGEWEIKEYGKKKQG